MKKPFSLTISSFLMASVFVLHCFDMLSGWSSNELYLTKVISHWHTYSAPFSFVENAADFLMEYTQEVAIAMFTVQLCGAVLLLVPSQRVYGAIALIGYLLLTTPLLHPFWFYEASNYEMQLELFVRNIGFLGGLLAVASLAGKKV